ncbi:MAG TPA: YCF48-related protein [Planctomycetota bacterium]|nr:YCF48-related protein [Planctomycetota bacterium]
MRVLGFATVASLLGSSLLAGCSGGSGGSPPVASPDGGVPPQLTWKRGGNVLAIWMVDATHGWTAEDGGRIRTFDGTEWKLQEVPDDVRGDLRDIMFVDTKVGWAVGPDGVLLTTVDGGAHWKKQTISDSGVKTDLWAVYVRGALDGWIAGHVDLDPPELSHPILRHTTDGGATWVDAIVDVAPPPDTKLYTIDFLPDGVTGIAAGENNTSLYTTDGATWLTSVWQGHPPQGSEGLEYWVAKIASPSTAYVVGGVGVGEGVLYRSTSSPIGAVWDFESCLQLTGGVGCVPCTGASGKSGCKGYANPLTVYGLTLLPGNAATDALAFAYGAQVLSRETTFGCWTEMTDLCSSEMAPALNHGSAIDSTTVWVGGQLGQIRKSTDAGATWTEQLDQAPTRLWNAWFESEKSGWVVGQPSRILKTTNADAPKPDWKVQHTLGPVNAADEDTALLAAIAMKPAVGGAKLGVAVGSEPASPTPGDKRPLVSRTFDGENWIDVSIGVPLPPEQSELRDVKWVSGVDEFWAAGKHGLLLRSTNGGANWTQVELPLGATTDLNAVAARAGMVFLAGAGGRSWSLALPSFTWTELDNPFPEDITDLAATPSELVAVTLAPDGGAGRVLVYSHATLAFESLVPEPASLIPPGQSLLSVDVHESGDGYRIVAGGDAGLVVQYDSVASSTAATPGWRNPPPKSQTTQPILGMSFVSADVGFVVAKQGTVLAFR